MMKPSDVLAVARRKMMHNPRLLSSMLDEAGVSIKDVRLLTDPEVWPFAAEVLFTDAARKSFIWTAGPDTPEGIVGTSETDADEVGTEWASVAVINIWEWVSVRDRENWAAIRPGNP